MTNTLHLPGYKALKVSDLDQYCQVLAEVSEPPTRCPYCNCVEIVGFGRRKETIVDVPIRDKHAFILIDRRRYQCKSCRKTFFEILPNKDKKRQMTHRLVEHIEQESLRHTFSQVADAVGVDEKTVRNIFSDFYRRIEQARAIKTPKWMGIDEIKIIKTRCIITNVEEQCIVDLLPDLSKASLASHLGLHQGLDQVRYVIMPMWRPYCDIIAKMMPDATVIIDKRHVLKMANESLERARKAIRNDLTTPQRRGLIRDKDVLLKRRHDLTEAEQIRLKKWEQDYPELAQAYALKEDFFDIFDSEIRDQAQKAYGAWLKKLTPGLAPHFDPLIQSVESWKVAVFAYFDHPATNDRAELQGDLTCVINSAGRGYSFEAMRAKALLAGGQSYSTDPAATSPTTITPPAAVATTSSSSTEPPKSRS